MAEEKGKANRKPRRKAAQKARDKKRIAEMYLHGSLQEEIAQEVGLDQTTISRIIKELQGDWLRDAGKSIDEAKARELAKVDDLELIYRAAWEASRGEIKTITRKGIAGKAQVAKQGTKAEPAISRQEVTEHIEQAVGDPRYLKGIEWCIEQRCTILGAKAPTRDLASILNIDVTKLSTEQLQRIQSGEDLVSVITNPSTSRA